MKSKTNANVQTNYICPWCEKEVFRGKDFAEIMCNDSNDNAYVQCYHKSCLRRHNGE